MNNILVTGGAGYIGSHTCLELLAHGYQITVIDNLVNSKIEAINRIKNLSGHEISFYQIDMRNEDALTTLFKEHRFSMVIHFAGLKAVGESVAKPLEYYHNNVTGTLTLLKVMQKYDVKNIVFSSSATVYGNPQTIPVTESHPLSAINPYGATKLVIEKMLKDLYMSDSAWNVIILRYFNPVGAHESGRIGEDPRGIPNNLMPYIAQVAVGRLPYLQIFGNDYPTSDGTGVRDYIHVVDLAEGHIAACEKLKENPGYLIYNLGTGRGYSVLEMVHAFEKVSDRKIPFKFVDRRPGDVAALFADVSKAQAELGWVARRGIEEMCRDTWRWQSQNPSGYEG